MDSIWLWVLIPAYNVEKYIAACIDSILMQTYSNWEMVIVDDGSTDSTGRICDSYAKTNAKIHIIHQSNAGQLSARRTAFNYVLEHNTHKNVFIMHVDGDDALKVNALNIICRTAISKQPDMIIFGMERVRNGKTIAPYIKKTSFSGQIYDKRDLYRRVFIDVQYNSLCRKAISIKLLTAKDYTAFYDIRHGEDLLQSIALYQACNSVVFINDILYEYTVNPNSITQNITYENYSVDSTVRRLVYEFLVQENVWNQSDFDEYLKYNRKLLSKKVRTIANLDTTDENKIRLFSELRSDLFYSMVLNSTKRQDFCLNLLKFQRYYLLLQTTKCINQLWKIRNMLLQARNMGKKHANT